MFEWTLGGVRCRISLLFPALLAVLLTVQPDGLAEVLQERVGIHQSRKRDCMTLARLVTAYLMVVRMVSGQQRWVHQV